MDLFDKTCIVTGASSGLGFEVTKGLARRGADTTLLCRDRARGEAAVLERDLDPVPAAASDPGVLARRGHAS